MLFKYLPTEELAERLMKSIKAPRDVKLQYTKHIAILVSYLKYLILCCFCFLFSVISSDMRVILPICMRNLKSGSAMHAADINWKSIMEDDSHIQYQAVPVRLVFLMDLRFKIKVAQLAIQMRINELTTATCLNYNPHLFILQF